MTFGISSFLFLISENLSEDPNLVLGADLFLDEICGPTLLGRMYMFGPGDWCPRTSLSCCLLT